MGFYFCSIKFYAEDQHNYTNIKFINFFIYIFNFIIGMWKKFPIFLTNSNYYEYLEIPITTACTLKCKNCSNLMPYYKKPCHMNMDQIEKSLNIFLTCIQNIVYIRILGGEPLLNQNIIRLINILLNSGKVQRVEIVTNGTIVPRNKELIRLLKNPKIIVSISDYKIVNNKKLQDFLKKNNIKFEVNKIKYWMDYGNMNYRGKTIKELKKQFRKCSSVCKSLINGQVHLCPRSSHGTDLNIIKDNQDDYVNLQDENVSIDEMKLKLRTLLKKDYIKACNFCDYGTKKCKKIPVAVQMKK